MGFPAIDWKLRYVVEHPLLGAFTQFALPTVRLKVFPSLSLWGLGV